MIRCRLAASEKKANTSARGLGSHCHVAIVYVDITLLERLASTSNLQLPTPNRLPGQIPLSVDASWSQDWEFGDRSNALAAEFSRQISRRGPGVRGAVENGAAGHGDNPGSIPCPWLISGCWMVGGG